MRWSLGGKHFIGRLLLLHSASNWRWLEPQAKEHKVNSEKTPAVRICFQELGNFNISLFGSKCEADFNLLAAGSSKKGKVNTKRSTEFSFGFWWQFSHLLLCLLHLEGVISMSAEAKGTHFKATQWKCKKDALELFHNKETWKKIQIRINSQESLKASVACRSLYSWKIIFMKCDQ